MYSKGPLKNEIFPLFSAIFLLSLLSLNKLPSSPKSFTPDTAKMAALWEQKENRKQVRPNSSLKCDVNFLTLIRPVQLVEIPNDLSSMSIEYLVIKEQLHLPK